LTERVALTVRDFFNIRLVFAHTSRPQLINDLLKIFQISVFFANPVALPE
jgi:hypothetical protein